MHENNTLREVELEVNSLCHVERSLLGIKYALLKSKTLLTFKEVNGISYLAFARLDIVMTFTTKKFMQTENFISEFLTLDVKPEASEIARTDVYKKTALYKHANKYESPFWEGMNLPVPTAEEERLILDLEKNERTKEGPSEVRR